MSPLQERLAELRAKVRQLLWLHGVSWLIAVLLGTLLIVGCCDWMLHLDDAGVRLILGLSIVAIVGYVAYRRLIAPLRVPLTDIDLALKIERRFPQFKDALASTIQFLQADKDPSLGAPELQQRVIDKTLRQAKFLHFEDVLQSKPVQRITWTAFFVLMATVLIVGLNRAEAATALKRLVFPFGSHPWPKRVHLQFVTRDLEPMAIDESEPLRIARGDTFELTAINLNDRGRLPLAVHLEFRHPDGSVTRETMQRTTIKVSSGQAREAAFSSLVIKTPFEFRAVGGDDQSMEWMPLEVVPPPVAESMQVILIPPKYTQRPKVKLAPGAGHIEGLLGTTVQIEAVANKPLGKSILRVRDKDQFPLKVASNGLNLSGTFTIKEAGVYSYWLDLRDEQNFGNSDAPRYEIRAVQDAVPDIYIDLPATDIQVTPTAEVPLRFVAKDDLALHAIRMQFTTQATNSAELSPQVEVPLSTLKNRPLNHSLDHLWRLETLKLTPEMKVQFHGEAIDEYDLEGAPHVGRSSPRTLTVVSPEEKTQELNDRQAGLLNLLERLKKQESEIESQTGELQKQMEKAGMLRPQDLDLLQRIEGQQRQVASSLQDPQDGVLAKTEEILSELKQNHIDAPDTKRRLDQIHAELQRLSAAHLPEIEQQLTQARKEVTGSDAPSTKPTHKDRPDDPKAESKANDQEQLGPNGQQSKKDAPSDQAGSATPDKNPSEKGTTPATRPAPLKSDSGATPKADQKSGETPVAPPNQVESKGAGTDSQNHPVQSLTKKSEKIPEQPRPGASAAEQALHRAQHHEQAVSETLDELLQELSQWQDQREATISVQEIRKGQEKVNKETAQLAEKTVSKSLQELSPQEQADLAKQAERQKHEAEQLDQLQRKLSDFVERLGKQNPDAAGRLQEAAEQLEQKNTAGKMRDAVRQLGENKIGTATQKQQEITKDLEALENLLKNEPTSDLQSMVKQLEQTEKDLASVQEEQEELIKKTKEAEQQADPKLKEQQLEELKKKQDELQKKADQLARKLERLKLERPAKAAARAAERMEQAQAELENDGQNDAGEQEQEAVEELEQARKEVAQERKKAEDSLAQEQLEKVSDEIKALADRQRGVGEEIKRLDAAHAAKGNWTYPQRKTLKDLAETQRGLMVETQGLTEKLSAAKVFALAAKGAARNMEQTAARLDGKEAGVETQQFAQAALQRFLDLLDAMKPEKPKKQEPGAQAEQPENNGGGGGQQQAPQIDPATMIAELKMLRSLQVDLNSRMLVLAAKRDQGNPLTGVEIEELKKLGEEQGELAELTAKFLELFEAGKADAVEAPEKQP
jgi:hypothetical protein